MIETDSTDKELIERYVSGDKLALPILVKRWHKILCEKAYWVLRDRELSKDVAQECWIIIIDKLPELKNTDSFKSWVLRIVYTKSIDAHKRSRKEAIEKKKVIHNYTPGPEKNEDRVEVKRKLLKAIEELPQDKQDIIRLFYIEEYTLKEISSFLGIPLGTVKSRLFKTREKLKSILKL